MPDQDAVARLNAALEGRYRVERQLGEGGMATVYLAEDVRHRRNVALKVLKPELAAVVGASRFLAEIETTANLQHPHILPLFDSGDADGLLFYVMPHVEGESLRARLDREHQLPVDEAVRIATNVAEALDYAHRHGVIHRDIKPANILLLDGKPVIADFGIALAVSHAGGGRLTETGLSLGTPHYMSPEQATGDVSVGPATDVWALGCVLYEMLVGEPPYTGSTPQAVLGKIIMAESPSATEARRSVPPHVEAAIARALEKVPADRFRSAEELTDALGNSGFRHGAGVSRGARPGPGLWNPLSMILAGVSAVMLLTMAWQATRPKPRAQVTRFALDMPEGIQTPFQGGLNIDISPDGSTVAFVGQAGDRGGRLLIYLRPLDELLPSAVPGTENALEPRFSPDGASLAFVGDRGIATLPLSGGPTSLIVPDLVRLEVGGFTWGPDGSIYFSGSDGGLWRSSQGRAEPERVTTPSSDGELHLWPDVLPGARALLFTRQIGSVDQSEIAVASTETGEVRTLLPGAMARYAQSGHLLYTSGVDGNLAAVRFDPETLETTGTAQTILDGVRVVADHGNSYFAISTTGALLYRTEGSRGEVETTPVWVSRDGSEEPLPLNASGRFRDPAISPDGRRIAFERILPGGRLDIWIYDRDQGGVLRRLTSEGYNLQPFWSPDGTEVGFSSTRLGTMALFSQPWDGSAPARLLRAAVPGRPLFTGVWSPDGRTVVYQEQGFPASSDFAAAAPHPDSTANLLLESPFAERSPALSPDGRWIAYESDESGRFEVYVRPFLRAGGGTPVSLDGGESPVWTPDGKEIIYREPGGAWWAASVRTESELAVTFREQLPLSPGLLRDGGTPHFDVSPEDGRILAIRGMSSDELTIKHIVVLNFFEELREVVPR